MGTQVDDEGGTVNIAEKARLEVEAVLDLLARDYGWRKAAIGGVDKDFPGINPGGGAFNVTSGTLFVIPRVGGNVYAIEYGWGNVAHVFASYGKPAKTAAEIDARVERYVLERRIENGHVACPVIEEGEREGMAP